jgi:ParB/RepB/Spo0J family partition protein
MTLIPLAHIAATSNRAAGGEGDIKILAEDMKKNGLINPVTLIRLPLGDERDGYEYDLLAGRRRVAAAKLLKWEEIPAVVREPEDAERAEQIALSENVNRLPMHPLDEAELFARIIEDGETVESLAKRFDYKVADIFQRVKLRGLSEGIQAVFREGRMSLESAAMIATLDSDMQEKFFTEYGENVEIDSWQISSFVRNVGKDTLWPFILTKKCAACTTRTRVADPGMFPELAILTDRCLDHPCYRARYLAVVFKELEKAREENPEYCDADLVCSGDSDILRVLGRELSESGKHYEVKQYRYPNRAQPGEKKALPAFEIAMTSDVLEAKPVYWKEEKKEKAGDDFFEPVIKLLNIPKTEAPEVKAALKECHKKARHEFYWDAKKKILDALIAHRVAIGPVEGDVDCYFKKIESREGAMKTEKTAALYRSCFGQDYEEGLAGIKHADAARIFMFLVAMGKHTYEIPDVRDFLKGKTTGLEWFMADGGKAKEIYAEAVRGMLPKAGKKAGKKKG